MNANKNWHKAVIERDNYICYVCKKYFGYSGYFNEAGVNQYVCGDHIKTKGARPELKYDVDNGRCVCFKCHELRHRGLA
tara:strand:+ start:594 stop:830 length:237 start_codon:yes stop_codon:yes gene_type:complete